MKETYTLPKDFTVTEVTAFKEVLYSKIGNEPVELTIDFKGCSFIDSTGLGAIVSVFKRLNSSGGSMVLVNMEPYVRDLFKMTRLDHVMTIED